MQTYIRETCGSCWFSSYPHPTLAANTVATRHQSSLQSLNRRIKPSPQQANQAITSFSPFPDSSGATSASFTFFFSSACSAGSLNTVDFSNLESQATRNSSVRGDLRSLRKESTSSAVYMTNSRVCQDSKCLLQREGGRPEGGNLEMTRG